jgi:hypothetical protein
VFEEDVEETWERAWDWTGSPQDATDSINEDARTADQTAAEWVCEVVDYNAKVRGDFIDMDDVKRNIELLTALGARFSAAAVLARAEQFAAEFAQEMSETYP